MKSVIYGEAAVIRIKDRWLSIAMGLLMLVIFAVGAFTTVWNRLDTFTRRREVADAIQRHKEQYLKAPDDRTHLDAIIQHARSNYSFGRCYAIGTLGKLSRQNALQGYSEEIAAVVAQGLRSNDAYVRHASALSLADMGEAARPAKLDLMEVITNHPDEGAALFAVRSLRNIGDPDQKILDTLRYAISAPDSFARKEAQDLLDELQKKKEQKNHQ